MPSGKLGCGWRLAGVASIMMFAFVAAHLAGLDRRTTGDGYFLVGETAVLYEQGASVVSLAITDGGWDGLADYDRAHRAGRAGAVEIYVHLIQTGQVISVPAGTHVAVIKTSGLARYVRVIDPQRYGLSGWIGIEHLRPDGPAR